MQRVVLVHWKEAEMGERVARVKKAGFMVTPFSSQGGAGLGELGKRPPAAFVIDLSRLPSHGREVAGALRQQKSTRTVPIVFVGGEYEKISRVRRELPDAIYTNWAGIGGAMKKAMAWKNEKPIVPGATAGYSGTPLPKKLGTDKAEAVVLLHAPKGFEDRIRAGEGAPRIRRGDRGEADLVIWFVKRHSELTARLDTALRAVAEGGSIWIAWPKKASGVKTDLSEDRVREAGLAAGVVDYKVCAIDETWSGLKFARRKKGATRKS